MKKVSNPKSINKSTKRKPPFPKGDACALRMLWGSLLYNVFTGRGEQAAKLCKVIAEDFQEDADAS